MLKHVSIVLKHTLKGKHYKSSTNRSWATENSDFVFFTFSTDDFLRMAWARPGINLILLLYWVFGKKNIRAKTILFCHVYNNTRGFKLANNVIRATFVAGISGPERQLSSILRLLSKRKLFVTNLLRLTASKHIFNDKYHKCITSTSQFMEIPNLEI